ncbi:hypothetical protein Bpfe_029087 [Biomphalaria pfeifferi]|uniref:Uncharacterized protein n=1 Tax=Biomphalaria pfeifferi TaxID=112525 RepID=A0AAD8ASC3_BIOPF|nr:hypothetical protein Bpfe_029087 [Biomphalaria pfeifferi]
MTLMLHCRSRRRSCYTAGQDDAHATLQVKTTPMLHCRSRRSCYTAGQDDAHATLQVKTTPMLHCRSR